MLISMIINRQISIVKVVCEVMLTSSLLLNLSNLFGYFYKFGVFLFFFCFETFRGEGIFINEPKENILIALSKIMYMYSREVLSEK